MVAGLMTRWICLLGLLGLIDAARGLRGTEDWTQCGILGKATPQKTRIVHGKDADQCVWRWQVSLSTPTSQYCGGTLISPGYVLTAAHCLSHVRGPCAVRALRVHAGSRKRVPGTTGAVVERHAKKIFLHPLYNQNVPHDYDFAIIQLDKAMPLNECIGLACLPNKDEKPGTNCSITGWGTLKSMGPTPDVLQEAAVTLLPDSVCERNYSYTKQVISGSMLCASGISEKGIVDTCQGDSGGPLSCREEGRYVLRGVTSWGQGCAYANFPGVYGKVQSVISWIEDVTSEKVRNVHADDKQEKMNISGIDFNGSMWAVIKGNCTKDSDGCIMSPGYPQNYTPKSICVFAVNASAAVPIKVVNFSTEEKFDALISDCQYFSGSKGPDKFVGSQSISPLLVSIESGNMEAAKTMLQDLMVIRADRARYYYGLNDLFKRHPEMVEILTQTAPELLPTMLDGMIWRSRTAVAGMRRVNYYLKHLLVDEEGRFATAMSSVVKLSDPNLAVHPVLETLCDIMWTDLVHWRFLRSKLRLLLTTVIFILGQSVLHHLDGADGSMANRIATFACRVLIYLYFMVGLIYDRARHVYQAIKKRHLTIVGGIRVPRKWVEDWQECVSLILTVLVVVMFYLEPVIYCLQSDHGSFTQNCDQAKSLQEPYQILSMLAILLQFSLIIDVATISTRLSSWVLLAGHVLPEFVMTCLACAFLILTFSCSVSASSENPEDFDDIFGSMMSFFKLAVSMYPASSFVALEDSILVLFITSCFRLIVIFFLLKLLIAQLTCEYRRIYRLMMGHARLCRMWKICEAMDSIHPSRFSKFVEKLRLDDPLDFSEGDHGVSGGIQVWEAANLHPTNVKTVKRLGGDPKNPFPLEEELQTEADKCRKVFHLFQKQMMAVKGQASVSSLGPSSGTAPSVNSVNSVELSMATVNS